MPPTRAARKSRKPTSPLTEPSPSRPRRRRVSKSKQPPTDRAPVTDKTVILAMSPGAANVLRVIIGRARIADTDDDNTASQLKTITDEISNQLNEMGL